MAKEPKAGWFECLDCGHPASCHRGQPGGMTYACLHSGCGCVLDQERVMEHGNTAGREMHDRSHPGRWDMVAHVRVDLGLDVSTPPPAGAESFCDEPGCACWDAVVPRAVASRSGEEQ